jgi:arylsulfatase A-like enzyme
MVRTKDAKYIYNPTAKDEFYDLTSDPWETRNIIGTVDSAKLKKMKTILSDEMKRTEDPLSNWASFTI